ncbi:MAG: acetate--CoA ligase family protein [Dehalococcoidales bacterium]|nr:acetate--CoA ligase family protein [Dehalococcoidales bacterium]
MQAIIERARKENRTILTEIESKALIGQAGINVNDTRLAKSRAEASSISRELGFPVVLKIASPDIVHKSDAGGIRLGLETPEQAEQAFDEIMAAARRSYPDADIQGVSVQKMAAPGVEIIIGMSRDAQFGPVLMFGLGGVFVEILEDVSLRVIPVNRRDVKEMIKEIKGYKMLTGYRNLPAVDEARLADMLLAVADFITQYPEIKELDLNPVIAYGDGAVAVDARIILEDPD